MFVFVIQALERKKKMRVTALLGAGATVDIGGIMSDELTQYVIEKEQKYTDRDGGETKRQFLKEIYNKLNEYDNKPHNFEDVFNLLEWIYSLLMSKKNTSQKTPLGAVLDISPLYDNMDISVVYRAIADTIKTIAECVSEYDQKFTETESNQFFRDFWNTAGEKIHWDIITLNYDTCVERSLDSYEDGFDELIEVSGFHERKAYRFNPRKLADTILSRVMHLHGCILYGQASPQKDPNQYIFKESYYDLYKYSSYEDACEDWYGRSNPRTQSGEQIIMGPLITGLRKAEKTIIYPYSFYLYEFQKALIENSRLLIVGYSCNDIYINNLLIRMAELHGKLRKIVIITYFPEHIRKHWEPSSYLRPVPMPNEYDVISRLLQSEYVEMLSIINLPKTGKLESKDHCVRIYFEGMKVALEKYDKEILEFLSE